MIDSKENTVRIEGLLSEVDIKEGSFQKNGQTVESIGGTIKIRVNQKLHDGTEQELEIPVHMFASKLTNKGTANPAYESIARVKNEFKSIASCGINEADAVRITSGSINMNEYYAPDGHLVSFPRINSSFVSKVKRDQVKPEATFSAIFVVGSTGFKVDKDGVEDTDTYEIGAILPQYGGKVDIVKFIATSKGVIDAVSNYWHVGDTVKANGRLNFSSRTETVVEDVDFGDPVEKTRTISVSELIITGGSSTPLDGEFAYDNNEIQTALTERQARLAALQDKAKGKTNKAPASTTPNFKDLGF